MKPRFKIMFIDGILLCLPSNHEAMDIWTEWNSKRTTQERAIFKKNNTRIPSTIVFWTKEK